MPPESTEDQKQPTQGKLSPEQRLSIAKRIEAGEKQIDLASEFGVTRQAVSLLMQKYRREGEEAITGARRGRKPSHKLSPDEEAAVHKIILSKKTPQGVGLELAAKEKNKWDADSVKRLIVRECAFTPTKATVADLLAKWDLLPKRERQFSQDYYDYINSDIGKEVTRRNWEMREKQLREKREAELAAEAEAEAKAKALAAGGAEGKVADEDGDEEVMEELEYTEEELAKIRQQMLAAGPMGMGSAGRGGPGQRTGKHSKGRGAHTPSRKKRKKKRKK
ncbi:MAG: helix-turn-helix domain-containing protein [Verrucomicrobiales bacterium]